MEIQLKPFQDRFIFSGARFPALVSAVGTGKTMSLILWVMRHMEECEDNLGIIVRKEFTDLKDSTMKDFERYTGLRISAKDIVLPGNRGTILFRHGEEINVLKNINAGVIGIEQAEEFDNDTTFIFLRDRLRRKEAKNRALGIIANANGHNWIYRLWKVNETRDPDFELHEATTFDNSDNLPEDYIRDLKKMAATHPEHYNRYVMNSWEDEDTVDRIIRADLVDEAAKREVAGGTYYGREKIVVTCDPARYGDDETVIYVMRNKKVIVQEIYKGKDTMYTAGQCARLKSQHSAGLIVVDVCGLGAGVVDRLREIGVNVVGINSATMPSSEEKRTKYRNMRTEMWVHAAEQFFNGDVCIPADDELITELKNVRYKAIESSGRLMVESKEEMKSAKRLGRSPDRADALVMGLWSTDNLTFESDEDYEYAMSGPKISGKSYFKRR